MIEAFGKLMAEILHPMNEIMQKIRGTQKRLPLNAAQALHPWMSQLEFLFEGGGSIAMPSPRVLVLEDHELMPAKVGNLPWVIGEIPKATTSELSLSLTEVDLKGEAQRYR